MPNTPTLTQPQIHTSGGGNGRSFQSCNFPIHQELDRAHFWGGEAFTYLMVLGGNDSGANVMVLWDENEVMRALSFNYALCLICILNVTYKCTNYNFFFNSSLLFCSCTFY